MNSSETAGPDRLRDWGWRIVPVLVGAAMVASNHWFTVVDDECAIIDRAAQPIYQTVRVFLRGSGQHEHPPLYDFFLHAWLQLTGGEMQFLRIPSIIFYVLGAWTLSKCAKELGGRKSQIWVLILVVLWPYGFHFGRLATWYSFSFLLVSLVTLTYLRYVDRPNANNWIWLLICSLALIYTSYFGWAFLACLTLDFAIRNRNNPAKWWQPLVGAGAILIAAYLPILAVFLKELRHGVHGGYSVIAVVLTGIYDLYCLFVSESVAPWFWALGVPAGIAICVSALVTLFGSPLLAKRFLVYFSLLFVAMTVLGILDVKRAMLIAAWLILPIGVTLGTLRSQPARRALIASLAVVGAVGWFGIFYRGLYAAPHWVEPWESVARQAAGVVHDGGIVIGNNPSFFFYLTYILPQEKEGAAAGFSGLLPDSTRRQNVYDPQQWIAAGRPMGPSVLFVKGLQYDIPAAPTIETEQWLDTHCSLTSAQQLVRDMGAKWKQRFSPATRQVEWRIRERLYGCR
ncbi:MAG: glycosyltransferase family 39 protein [Candidatus Acidiferrales bacterium]